MRKKYNIISLCVNEVRAPCIECVEFVYRVCTERAMLPSEFIRCLAWRTVNALFFCAALLIIIVASSMFAGKVHKHSPIYIYTCRTYSEPRSGVRRNKFWFKENELISSNYTDEFFIKHNKGRFKRILFQHY